MLTTREKVSTPVFVLMNANNTVKDLVITRDLLWLYEPMAFCNNAFVLTGKDNLKYELWMFIYVLEDLLVYSAKGFE